jgi:hypothetical protein
MTMHTIIGLVFFGGIAVLCVVGYLTGHEPYDEQK